MRDQGWKSRMTGRIGIGADLKQCADKRQRAVVNRIGPDWQFGNLNSILERFPILGQKLIDLTISTNYHLVALSIREG
jgi:hypothetical protein